MDGAVGIVFNKKGELLLVKRRDVPVWVFPGGGIEIKETPLEAVRREVMEESGFRVKIERKMAEYTHNGTDKKNYVFECEIVSGKATRSHESKKVEFFPLEALPNPRHPVIDEWLADLNLKRKGVIKRTIEPVSNTKVLKQILRYPVPVIRYFLLKAGIRINI